MLNSKCLLSFILCTTPLRVGALKKPSFLYHAFARWIISAMTQPSPLKLHSPSVMAPNAVLRAYVLRHARQQQQVFVWLRAELIQTPDELRLLSTGIIRRVCVAEGMRLCVVQDILRVHAAIRNDHRRNRHRHVL